MVICSGGGSGAVSVVVSTYVCVSFVWWGNIGGMYTVVGICPINITTNHIECTCVKQTRVFPYSVVSLYTKVQNDT